MTTAHSVPRRTLDDWLAYQQQIHAVGVDLGLARVGEVWQRMGAPRVAPVIISVGGTNGKGSTVAFLDTMLADAGQRVGCYTSPHLLHYNERVRVAGRDVDDDALIDAFERIESARLASAPVPLTYFEFGTLTALCIFAQSKLDVAVLEVGLGGRLDAVNIIDADAAIVTTIDLDHQDWLGNDRDSIAREKAGIFRARCLAVIGDAHAPQVLDDIAAQVGAHALRAGRDYCFEITQTGWTWQADDKRIELPAPELAAPAQYANAAAAIATLYALRARIRVDDAAIACGVRNARVPARLQRFIKLGSPELVVDVAHNPQAARELAQYLREHATAKRNLAVFGALADKDVPGIIVPLVAYIAQWFGASLDQQTARGLKASDIATRVAGIRSFELGQFDDVACALDAAMQQANSDDRVLAFGSFFVAGAALEWAARHGFVTAAGQSG